MSARLCVRQLTHTLHLPSTFSELYDAPGPAWFEQLQKALPNLQSLIVSGLPFFDHRALFALASCLISPISPSQISSYQYPLRLLNASSCSNTTASSLGQALGCLTKLVYLDLSGCTGVRDEVVLSRFRAMPDLQVLKLQRCKLRDADISELMAAILWSVRSLDLTGNLLSNLSAPHLAASVVFDDSSRDVSRTNRGTHSISTVEEWTGWPVSAARPDPAVMDEFRDESLNERFMQRLTSHLVARLPSQDLPHTGITHLYISGNQLTIGDVRSLVSSRKLHVLDVGRISSSNFDEVEHLIRALEYYASEMTYLRLHHSVVTGETPLTGWDLKREPINEGTNDSVHSEAEMMPPDFEVVINQPAPPYEPREASTPLVFRSLRDEGVNAVSSTPDGYQEPLLEDDATSLLAAALKPAGQATHKEGGPANHQERTSRRHGLLPHMVPSLRTLALTNVPTYEESPSESPISESLIRFIEACAQRAEIGRQSSLSMSGPPSRTGRAHLQSPPSPFFALKRIILELEAPAGNAGILEHLDLPLTALYPAGTGTGRTLSSTGDVDSENFWVAAENDYSFFGDEERVRSRPRPHSSIRSASNKEQATNSLQRDSLPRPQQQPNNRVPTERQSQAPAKGKDIVQEIAKFRKERKVAFEHERAKGQLYTEGYWNGEIQVVRYVE